MAVSRIKEWVSGEVLNASDLNAELDNLNQTASAFPLTENVSAAGYAISNAVLGTLKQLNENVYCIDNYADFAGAISGIGSATSTLLINKNVNVTANATVPSTLTLWFVGAGKLTVSVATTATINGPVRAEPRQIFAGSGTVAFTSNYTLAAIHPQWWGAAGDNSTADTTAIQSMWTASGGTSMVLTKMAGHVFSGRFDGTAGDIGLSPLLPGFMGRFYHYYEPQYNLASNLLSVMHYFKTGTITIPTSSQHNVMRFDGTITGGTKFKGIDWQYTVTDSTDAYCAIGLLINQGSGSTKAIYGRAQASTGCTGVVVGAVAACTVDSGITPSAAMGLEISLDGTGSATEHSALRIDTAESSNVIDYGLLSLSTIGYGNAFIKGFKRTGAGGNAFEWTDQSTSRDLFVVDENGNVAVGSTADPQKTITLANGSRTYTMQAVTTGDYWRITAGSVGDIIKVASAAASAGDCALSIWGNNTASGAALLQVSFGAADSGGTGYRLLRVEN